MRRILLQKLHASSLRGSVCFAQIRWFSEVVSIQFSSEDIADITCRLKNWFQSSPHIQTDRKLDLARIFEILRAPSVPEDGDVLRHQRLSRLGLRLSEKLVLRVLSHGGKDVISCIRFFDWASRQPGFYHTRATFHAYFKLLRRAGRLPDFSIRNSLRLSDALVIGYSVVGRVDIALRQFSSMRFRGMDLGSFGYHVLLNALVEENCFDTVDVIADQISSRGFLCAVTHSILIKSFCKQGRLAEAVHHFRGLLKTHDDPIGCSSAFSLLVDALCSLNLFHQASRFLDEIRELGTIPMDRAYSIWIKAFIRAGNLREAVHFLHKLNSLKDGSVLDVFRYNSLALQLLRKNQLTEACDVMIEMAEQGVDPDQGTMNAILCLFCKVGLVDVALDFYQSRSEIGLTPTAMAYNYLISTLCEQERGGVEQAYGIFKASIDQGYFPGRNTLRVLTEALCLKRKLDDMKELVLVALKHGLVQSRVAYGWFVSALCEAGRVEDGLLMHEEFNRAGIGITGNTFNSLICVSVRSNKGDMAAKLLIEMQEKGYAPTKRLYRTVICCLCGMEKCVNSFFNLLEMHLRLFGRKVDTYSRFIDGAGHARKPELATRVYDLMAKDGVTPNLDSNILMLKCYIKNAKFSDALNFFDVLQKKGVAGRKLYTTLIVGLCKAKKGDIAIFYFNEMKCNELHPSRECYEEVIQNLCTNGMYDEALTLVNEFRKTSRRITSFIGNVLLLNALKSQRIYEVWIQMRDVLEETPEMRLLGVLIGIFSGRVRMTGEIKMLDEVIEKCYPLSIYTYNMLLRRLMVEQVDEALQMVKKLCQRGYEPDKWTCMIVRQGLCRVGRGEEAKKWLEALEVHDQ